MSKEAFLTRLDRENAQFMAQQCLLASDEYRRFTPADMLRMVFIGARKAYIASGSVRPFCEWWQAKYQEFLQYVAYERNQENQENQENHENQPKLLSPQPERGKGTLTALRFQSTTSLAGAEAGAAKGANYRELLGAWQTSFLMRRIA